MEVSPDVPQGLSYGTFSSGTIKPASWITMGANNLGATRNATGSGFAGILGNIGIFSGRHYWESSPIGTTTLNYAWHGLVNSLVTAYETASGADNRSMMMHSGNGRLIYQSAIGANLGQILPTDIVRWWVDFDARTLKVAKNGGAWVLAAEKFESQGVWYPCINAQVSGYGWSFRPGGGTGLTAYVYGLPDGQTKAYSQQLAPVPTTVRMASRAFTGPDYLSGLSPPMPFEYYDGRMSVRSDITMKRAIGVWMWGNNSGAAQAIGYIDFINTDGALSVWKTWTWRNKRLQLCYVNGDAPTLSSEGKVWVNAIADRVEDKGKFMRLHLVDQFAQLQKPANEQTVRTQASLGNSAGRDVVTVGEDSDGIALPFVLGIAYQSQPYNINPAPAVREYQFSSDTPLSAMLIYDKCDPYDELVTGLDFRRTQRTDGFRIAPSIAGPDGKVTGDIVGPWRRGTQRIDATNGGAFTSWSGDNPVGWTVLTTETATCKFTQNGAACRIMSNGTSTQGMQHVASTALFAIGKGIEVQFTVTALPTPGPIFISVSNGINTSVRRVQLTAVGTYRVACAMPAGNAAYTLYLGSGNNVVAGDSVDATIDDFAAWEYTPITTVEEFIKYLIVDRGGFVAGDINAASVGNLSGKFNPALGFYSPDSVNIDQILRAALDSFGGFVYLNRLGAFCVGRLDDVTGQVPAIAFEPADIVGELSVDADPAKSLTTLVGGMRNWSPTDPASMAGSVSQADRKKWSQRNQVTRQAAGVVDPFYSFADKAKVRDTLLQTTGDVRNEAARIATLYSTKRHFYSFTVMLDIEAANELNPGDIVRLTYPLHGLDNGRELMLVSITHKFFSQAVELVLWG